MKDIKEKTEGFYEAVYDILVRIGRADPKDKSDFVRSFMDKKYPCTEWRFCGLLGFGGKYRSYNKVNCYSEDETPERLDIELEKLKF
jgi:hypothetical protein